MKIHHIRNATFVIEEGKNFILIDPMLGQKGSFPPVSFIRHKARRNPTIDLPYNTNSILEKVNHCLITHCQKKHLDHLDKAGISFLINRNIPVTCYFKDELYLKNKGIIISNSLNVWEENKFLEGIIIGVPAEHGTGWIKNFMANGIGFYIEFQNKQSIYISGDTILTKDVKKALHEFKPNISVVASGMASIDIGQPILMSLKEIIEFIRLAPDKVIANHLESINHCPMTREMLRIELKKNNLLERVIVPDDGQVFELL